MTSLHLKKYKWNVKSMNQAVRETVAQLEAVGYNETQNSIRFRLIRGYKPQETMNFTTSFITFQIRGAKANQECPGSHGSH